MNAWAGLEEESPMFVASLVGGGAPQWSQHFYNVQLSTVVHYKLYGSKKEIQEFRWHFDTIICQLKPKKESQIHNYQNDGKSEWSSSHFGTKFWLVS